MVGRVVGLATAFQPHLRPLVPQRLHQHRLHNQVDIVLAGVVRPQLRPLAFVYDALEQRAKDGGVNG